MRKYIILILLACLFLQHASAEYFVPPSKQVRLLLLYHNNRNEYIILYNIQITAGRGANCTYDQYLLPQPVAPGGTLPIVLTCKFSPGQHKVDVLLNILANGTYPGDEFHLYVVASDKYPAVTVNGYFLNTSSPYFYYVHVGDIIRVVTHANYIIGQSPQHLKIISYYVKNDTAVLILKAISQGIDRIYVAAGIYIDFDVLPPVHYNLFYLYEQLEIIYSQIANATKQIASALEQLNKSKQYTSKQYQQIIARLQEINEKYAELQRLYTSMQKFLEQQYQHEQFLATWYEQQYNILLHRLQTEEQQLREQFLERLSALQENYTKLQLLLQQYKYRLQSFFSVYWALGAASAAMVFFLLFRLRKYKKETEQLYATLKKLTESPVEQFIAEEELWKRE